MRQRIFSQLIGYQLAGTRGSNPSSLATASKNLLLVSCVLGGSIIKVSRYEEDGVEMTRRGGEKRRKKVHTWYGVKESIPLQPNVRINVYESSDQRTSIQSKQGTLRRRTKIRKEIQETIKSPLRLPSSLVFIHFLALLTCVRCCTTCQPREDRMHASERSYQRTVSFCFSSRTLQLCLTNMRRERRGKREKVEEEEVVKITFQFATKLVLLKREVWVSV